MSDRGSSSFTATDFIKNFPFVHRRESQTYVINKICEALNSGYKHILLEAPTGFGKSPVAIAVAMTMGSSYICTSTKDLQTQYSRDFSFLKVAKGANNFRCLVKEDFIRNKTYRCGICSSDNIEECRHTSVEYGPCMTNESFQDHACKYRTFVKDYKVTNKGTRDEQIYINKYDEINYQKEFSQWLHLRNLKYVKKPREWKPCEYFNQLNIALSSGHSIFNYSNFLAFLPNSKILHPRELLVLDEGHLLETEIVKFRGLSLSKRRWKRYIQDLQMVDYGYDNLEQWIEFLIELETRMLTLIGNTSMIELLALQRKIKYGLHSLDGVAKGKYESKPTTGSKKKRVVSASNLYDSDDEIAQKYQENISISGANISEELAADAIRDTERLTITINNILSNPRNWIIAEIKKEGYEVIKVELKPLDISPYCKHVFEKCSKVLIMSATILDPKAFCRSVGLMYDKEVKFIQVKSDFPIENRPIYPMNIAYLNFNNLQLPDIKSSITKTIDNIMTIHKKDKGIVHTTSYEQLNFIKEKISQENTRRLLVTDPEIQRDEIIQEHINSIKPTVLISPSLHTGLDLKGELSRFQIITKVPYPNKNDRWINAKRNLDEDWYYWQTALKLVQASGRSIRSKEDWAKTYILDSAFGYFVNKNRDILPDWFMQAVRGRS
ncbi:MAG TPA: ATP-dependent DNA helicase [Nitrososphaeraceae archaeon]